jgi:hypothetical protein
MKKFALRSILLGLLASGLGLGAGVAAGVASTPAPAHESRTPLSRTPKVQDTAIHGAHDGAFDLAVEPAAIVSAGGGEALEFTVRVDSHVERGSSHRLVHVIADDQGRAVGSAVRSDLFRLAGAKAGRAFTLRTPNRLADGYYMLRVTAAGSDGERGATVDAEQYFQVRRGQISPLSFEEWTHRSRANRAIEG